MRGLNRDLLILLLTGEKTCRGGGGAGGGKLICIVCRVGDRTVGLVRVEGTAGVIRSVTVGLRDVTILADRTSILIVVHIPTQAFGETRPILNV